MSACTFTLTVISPIYNQAPYLDRFLSCVAPQLSTDVEVVLVDDGSTDGSGEICNRWASEHYDVTVIHQTNQGVSSARNAGLEAARGEYIWFCDSDDEIMPGAVDAILREIEHTHSKMYIFGCNCVDSTGKLIRKLEPPRQPECKEDGLFQIGAELYTPCYIFSKDVAMGHRFTAGRKMCEDREFIYRCSLDALGSITSVNEYIYMYYLDNPGSATNNMSIRKELDAYEVNLAIYHTERDRGFPEPALTHLTQTVLSLQYSWLLADDSELIQIHQAWDKLLDFRPNSSRLSLKSRLTYTALRYCHGPASCALGLLKRKKVTGSFF